MLKKNTITSYFLSQISLYLIRKIGLALWSTKKIYLFALGLDLLFQLRLNLLSSNQKSTNIFSNQGVFLAICEIYEFYRARENFILSEYQKFNNLIKNYNLLINYLFLIIYRSLIANWNNKKSIQSQFIYFKIENLLENLDLEKLKISTSRLVNILGGHNQLRVIKYIFFNFGRPSKFYIPLSNNKAKKKLPLITSPSFFLDLSFINYKNCLSTRSYSTNSSKISSSYSFSLPKKSNKKFSPKINYIKG